MRSSSIVVAVFVVLGSGYALAQGGGLAGVTMRVVDDLSGIDAVVLQLDAAPAENTEGADDAERPAAQEREVEDSSGRRERDDSEGVDRSPAEQPPAGATRSL